MNRVAIGVLLLVCFVLSLLAPLRWLWALAVNPNRATEILKGYDLFGNSLFNGTAGEYISTRAYVAGLKGARWALILCWMLDQVEPGHCRKSYEGELARLELLQQEGLENYGAGK